MTMPIGDLFRHPTVTGFAAHASALRGALALDDAGLLADIEAMTDEEVERMLGQLESPRPPADAARSEAAQE